jgi:polyvinyl alcohol dehydrogenase (cytochrome)
VALDLDTGAVKWATGVREFDVWTLGCVRLLNVNCPLVAGADADFGSGPNLFSVNIQGQTRQLLGAGAKSGVYWALDPDTGKIVWSTRTGPGGLLGGIMWGAAVDGQRVYAANANSSIRPWTLVNGQTVRGGFWSALDAATGKILWQTADPSGAISMGTVTVANGVVYAGSVAPNGTLYALDAATAGFMEFSQRRLSDRRSGSSQWYGLLGFRL